MLKQDTQQDSQTAHFVPYAKHSGGKELTDSPSLQAAQAAKQESMQCAQKLGHRQKVVSARFDCDSLPGRGDPASSKLEVLTTCGGVGGTHTTASVRISVLDCLCRNTTST